MTDKQEKRAPRQPRFRVTIVVTAANIVSLRKKAAAAFGEEATEVAFRKVKLDASRADRLDKIAADVADAAGTVEELKEELEQWKESLPENLQDGDKASELDEAISQLEDIHQALDGIEFDVAFPGMY